MTTTAIPEGPVPERARGLATHDVQTFLAIYAQLKPRAHQLLAGHREGTLDTTSLVHEAFLKLLRHAGTVNDQRHLDRIAVLAMRQILLDRVRSKGAERHGGDVVQVTLDGISAIDPVQPYDVVLFDGILDRLRELDARRAEVFELRVLGGLEMRQIAELVQVSEITVRRDVRAASTLVEHWLKGG